MGGGLLIMLVLVYQGRAATTTGPLYSSSDETTTEEIIRGTKKFGDKCDSTSECGFRGSVCDESKKLCQCRPEFTVTNHYDKCGQEVDINGTCFFTEQCENRVHQTECRDGRCACRFEKTPLLNKDKKMECIDTYEPPAQVHYVDPAMIGVLVGMALMFIIICVVLRLFSKARWRDNRTIFNTPNPRLMNVSLLRDNKAAGERRGSKGAPSRQPSLASLRPQSPAAQSQGSRVSPRGSLRGSRSSSGSAKSPTTIVQQPPPHHHQPLQPQSSQDVEHNSVG